MKYGDFIHDPEDKDWWVVHGAGLEEKFVKEVCPRIGIEGFINPEKKDDPTKPDLVVKGRLADLKCQNTPFFTASRYYKVAGGEKVHFDPTFTVTFNKKDYLNYRENYPEIDIYYWVHWRETEYNGSGGKIKVSPLSGVWFISFEELAALISKYNYPLHTYQRRRGDRINAQESFLVDLRDLSQLASFK